MKAGFTISIDVELLVWLKNYAIHQGKSASEVVAEMCRKLMEEEQRKASGEEE